MRSIFLLAGALAIGCGAHRVAPTFPPLLLQSGVVIPREPPPGRVELVPPQPRTDAVWIDGVWNWTDRRWVWTKGAWVIAPAEAVYSPWTVTRGPDARLYFSPATWRDARGQVLNPPPPLTTATVTTVPVVNYDGTQARTVIKQD